MSANSVIASLLGVTEELRFVLSRAEGQIAVQINGRSEINECKAGEMDLGKVWMEGWLFSLSMRWEASDDGDIGPQIQGNKDLCIIDEQIIWKDVK